MSAKYGLGFNGHAKCCDCKPCAWARVRAMRKVVEANPEPKLDPTKSIFVKAHFRRGKHLTQLPITAFFWHRELRRMKRSAL